jgi:hypothetical protein
MELVQRSILKKSVVLEDLFADEQYRESFSSLARTATPNSQADTNPWTSSISPDLQINYIKL